MANVVEITTIKATTFVPPTSRYASSPVEYYSEKKKITFTTYKRTPTRTSDADKFTVISKGSEYRPDLVSFHMYGTVDFWWKIMEANGMKDVMEFKAGTNIRLPNNVFS